MSCNVCQIKDKEGKDLKQHMKLIHKMESYVFPPSAVSSFNDNNTDDFKPDLKNDLEEKRDDDKDWVS